MRATAVFLAAATLCTGCGKTVPTDPGMPTDRGPDAAADRARLNGVWLVDGLELPDGESADPERVKGVRFVFDGPKFRISEPGRGATEQFSFALDTTQNPKVLVLTEIHPDGSPVRVGATFRGTSRGTTARVGSYQSGTARAGTARSDGGPVDRQEWIYTFEGETLVIAFRSGRSGGRPTGFKAEAGQPGRTVPATSRGATAARVYEPGTPPTIVVRLKKTTESPPPAPSGFGGTARGYATRR